MTNNNHHSNRRFSSVTADLFNTFKLNNLRGDISGGLTAAIVSLPIALAFGVASGAGPEAGLYGAVLVGFFAALFGGGGLLLWSKKGKL